MNSGSLKIFLTASTLEVKASRQRQKLNAVNYLLDKYGNVQKRRFLRKLAECLLFPDSYLISLPEKLLSEENERLKKRLALRENGKCVEGMKSEECYKI